MTHFTDHLTKLTCAAHTARDLGYVHTGRALDRLVLAEQKHLKGTTQKNAAGRTKPTRQLDSSEA